MLSPAMAKTELDTFLEETFGVQSNPFTVEEVFDASKEPTAWKLIQKVLKRRIWARRYVRGYVSNSAVTC